MTAAAIGGQSTTAPLPEVGVGGGDGARPQRRGGGAQAVRNRALKAGPALLGVLDLAFDQLRFYLRVVLDLPKGLRYRREITLHISDITVGTGALVIGGGMLFVVTSIAFFTGTEVGLEGFTGLQQIGAQAFVGVISSLANTREITPLVAGVALAAQVGAGFTAQLGAMRISEEIDALEVMSVDSFTYLVTTRVWAALICMIPLYLAALFASFLATEIIVTKFFGLSAGVVPALLPTVSPSHRRLLLLREGDRLRNRGHDDPLLLRVQRHRRPRRSGRRRGSCHSHLDHRGRGAQPHPLHGHVRWRKLHCEARRMTVRRT